MKKAIWFIVLFVCLCSTALAADNKIYVITSPVMVSRNTVSTIVCIDGYKWVVTQTQPEYTSPQSGFGVSANQIFRRINNFGNPPQAVKCTE